MATKKKKGNQTKRANYQLKKTQKKNRENLKKTQARKNNLAGKTKTTKSNVKDQNVKTKKTSTKSTGTKKSTTQKNTNNINKTVKKTQKKKSINILNIIKNICKLILTLLKTIIKLPITFYNGIKSIFKNRKNKKKNINKKVKDKTKNKKTIKEYKIINDDDDPHKLRYRDYRGLKKIAVFFINRHKVMRFDMRRFKKRFKYGTLKDRLLIILMLLLILGVSLIIAFCAYIVVTAPEITAERLYKGNATVLYDINGNEFARLGLENREKITYDELPEVLVDAIIATEDSRFFQHNGVDIARFTKAVIGQLLGSSGAGGASTLTMQVSKQAATSAEKRGLVGIVRKFQDVYLSVFVFEKKFTKEQIMEFYVNLPDLGASTFGVEQASQTYFGKSVTELNLSEAALIAGLFQAPYRYNPYTNPEGAAKRRKIVLNLMYRHGYITKEEMDAANSVAIEDMLVGQNKEFNKYQGFIDTVIEDVKARTGQHPAKVSMKIYTTLDPKKQDVINNVYETYNWKNDVVQAGIAVVSVKDGSIVAVGTGRNVTTALSWNIATMERRHPGSTAKPILDYGPAIEYLNWSTGQTIVDDKMTYSNGVSIKNWDNNFSGVMMAKTALAESRNIPALQTFQQTTNEQKKTFSRGLGWKAEEDGNGNILEACSIGGFNGVTPLESAAAYATFARGGTYIEPYSFTSIEYTETGDTYKVTPEKRTVMSEETAYMVNMILKYAVTSGQIGAGSVSGTDICAKTGTSTIDEESKKLHGITASGVINDSWEVAYSPDYAISLWYGYRTLSKEHYLTTNEGNTARGQITRMLTKGIMEPNARFSKPNGVVTAEIEKGTDPLELASEFTPEDLRSTEYFKKGTVPTTKSTRFAQLSNISNLKYTSTGTTLSLSWTAAATPDAINEAKLKEYFNNSSVYKRWADKYLQERLTYNANTFGAFGYRVYLKTATGLQEIGFTTSTSFKKDIVLTADTTVVVKTSYEKFPANMSSGVTITVKQNSTTETTPTNPSEQVTNMYIEYLGPTCSTVNSWNNLGGANTNKFRVNAKINGTQTNITAKSKIDCTCYNQNDNVVSCTSMTQGSAYDIKCTATYNGVKAQKNVTIKPSC